MEDLDWFNDRSKFKGLDWLVAFDMKGQEDSNDQRLLAVVAVAVEKSWVVGLNWNTIIKDRI